jgi:hypothetical protein
VPVLTHAAATFDLIRSRGPSYGPVIDFERQTASAPLLEEAGPPFGSCPSTQNKDSNAFNYYFALAFDKEGKRKNEKEKENQRKKDSSRIILCYRCKSPGDSTVHTLVPVVVLATLHE